MTGFQWADATTGTVKVNGKTLEFACFGPAPADAPTIILLHEGLGSVAQWKDFPQRVAEATGHGVFVYSRAGHGASDSERRPRTLDHSARHAHDDLPIIFEQIGLQKAILFGHSDGATIAAIYAGSVIDHRIRGLILMAPHFFTEPIGLAEIAKAKTAYETGDLRARMAKYHKDPDNCFWGWNNLWLDPGFVEWNISDVIDYWRIPVLAIQGRNDQYGTLAQISEIEDRIYAPVNVEILEDCRHSPHFDQPDKTLDLVVGFTTQLQRIEREPVEIPQFHSDFA